MTGITRTTPQGSSSTSVTDDGLPWMSGAAETQAAFRAAFRNHPAGVSVITATVDGEPVGLTVSSLASLSLEPLAVSFSLMKSTGTAGKLLEADTLLVHLLSAGQADIAASFAGTGAPRFAEHQGWRTSSQGEPFLPEARTIFRVRIADTAKSGDATLIAAQVTDIYDSEAQITSAEDAEEEARELAAESTVTSDPEVATEPLIFKNHKFYSLEETPPLA